MEFCNVCNQYYKNINKHNKTKKHINEINIYFFCKDFGLTRNEFDNMKETIAFKTEGEEPVIFKGKNMFYDMVNSKSGIFIQSKI